MTSILVAHYTQSRGDKVWIDRNLIVCLLAIPIAFLLTTLYAVLDYKSFIADIRFEAVHYSSGHFGHEGLTSTSFYLYGNYLITKGYGTIPIIFAGLGLIWLLRKAPWKAAIIVVIPIVLYIFVGRYKVFFARNLMATIPFLSLLSGFFIFALYETLTKKLSFLSKPTRALVVTVALIIVLSSSVWQQIVVVLNHIEWITLPDTRWVSIEWIKMNLPSGSIVGREPFTPPVEKYTGKFNIRYFDIFDLAYLDYSVVKKLDYMILSFFSYGKFLNNSHVYLEEAKAYKEFFKTHELVKEFIPDGKTLGGPRIRVYKIKHCLDYRFGAIGQGWLPLTGDWDGDGSDTVGFYDPSTGKFFLKNRHEGGVADLVYRFGAIGQGWLPLTGDWDGDGSDTVGFYDPSTGKFFLKNRHEDGVADLVYRFGAIGQGWLPLTGDWDGDGTDTAGLYESRTSQFFLRNIHAGGAADLNYHFNLGRFDWIPLGGDWDGDGIDTVGYYDPLKGWFLLTNSQGDGDNVSICQAADGLDDQARDFKLMVIVDPPIDIIL